MLNNEELRPATDAATPAPAEVMPTEGVEDKTIEVCRLTVTTANKMVSDALTLSVPEDLWRDLGLIYDNEVTCLFSDTNTGKSVLAVQIGEEIAREHDDKTVLYIDYELNRRQFGKRYTDRDNGTRYMFSDRFMRAELTWDPTPWITTADNASALTREALGIKDDSGDYPVAFEEIQQAVEKTEANVLIIDNLSWVEQQSHEAHMASRLMQFITSFKREMNLTVIVIAHTPKRMLSMPLSENDVAGSKRLMNFMDAAFAIGRSMKDPSLRYIKQIKCRCSEMRYDADNVITCQIVKGDDAFLKFELGETCTESEHLEATSAAERRAMRQRVKELQKQGMSQRQIAAQMGLSVGAVNKYLRAGTDDAPVNNVTAKDEPVAVTDAAPQATINANAAIQAELNAKLDAATTASTQANAKLDAANDRVKQLEDKLAKAMREKRDVEAKLVATHRENERLEMRYALTRGL